MATLKKNSGFDPEVDEDDRSETLGVIAFQRIHADIIAGVYPPGDKLKLENLKKIYGIGMSPLREALSGLARDGLIVVESQRGFRVAPATQADLFDLFETRRSIEGLVLANAIANGDDAWEARVAGNFHRLQKLSQDPQKNIPSNEDWEIAHREFHFALVSSCRSRWLLKFHRQLWDHAARYRRISRAYNSAVSPSELLIEHKGIFEAAMARDSEVACALSKRHLSHTLKTILSVLSALSEDGNPTD